MRSLIVAAGIWAVSVALSPWAWADEADSEQVEKVPAGRSVFFAAELGTTADDILGMGFEKNLSRTDANGDVHRVYPAKYTDVAVNQYDAKFEAVDNSLMLEAHGHYLFVEAGMKVSKSKRYMVVRVYQINKVAKLQQEGKPQGNAPMYASKVYYGWALYLVIEGDASSFTADVAANLQKAGGKIGTVIESQRLKSKVHLIGLSPKKPGDIPIAVTADDVLANFEPAKEPQPIFVEYTLMQDLAVDAIPWMKNELKAGRYNVSVNVVLMDNKATGDPWDAGGNMPDPHVTLFVNGQPAASCKQQDSIENNCIHDKLIDVDKETTIQILVIEKDLADDDSVGYTEPMNLMASGGAPGMPIPLRTQGQLRSAKVTLTPVQ